MLVQCESSTASQILVDLQPKLGANKPFDYQLAQEWYYKP